MSNFSWMTNEEFLKYADMPEDLREELIRRFSNTFTADEIYEDVKPCLVDMVASINNLCGEDFHQSTIEQLRQLTQKGIPIAEVRDGINNICNELNEMDQSASDSLEFIYEARDSILKMYA